MRIEVAGQGAVDDLYLALKSLTSGEEVESPASQFDDQLAGCHGAVSTWRVFHHRGGRYRERLVRVPKSGGNLIGQCPDRVADPALPNRAERSGGAAADFSRADTLAAFTAEVVARKKDGPFYSSLIATFRISSFIGAPHAAGIR